MALRITRNAGSILYGGLRLNPDNLEGSYDHRIWFRRIRDHRGNRDAIVNIKSLNGVSEHVILAGDRGIWITDDVNISIEGIQQYFVEGKEFCGECGRGDESRDRTIPQAQLLISAPREYGLIRDDAKRKKTNFPR